MSIQDPFQTPERRALADSARQFTQRHISPEIANWERAGRIPRELHRLSSAAGFAGLGFSQEMGGSGGDIIDTVVLIEEILRAGGSGGLIAGLFTQGIATPHVIDEVERRRNRGDQDGAEYLLNEYVTPIMTGQCITALAVTEPDGGSDVANLLTRADVAADDPETLVVNGSKTFITSAVRADFITVAVRTGGPGAPGVSLAIVPTDSPGFQVTRELEKMGWHCSDTAELAFADVRIPRRNLLGDQLGFASLARHFATERLTLAVTAYATAQRCLDLTVRYCRLRETFGRSLIHRQVVRHQLVEMYRVVDVARTYARQVALRKAAQENVATEALLAKQTAVEACQAVVDRAVQLHGGAGYMSDNEVERHYRDSRILGIGGGATEVMTDLAAKLLGF
jgi:acyl-CoA dehydrogenase